MTHPLSFGPAGIPQSVAGKGIVRGVEAVKEMGLGCMELEFVQSVYLKEDKAKEVMEAKKKTDIRLSVHAPYYINLNAKSPETMRASIERLYLACKMGGIAGAESVAVHAAFRHEQSSKEIKEKILGACAEIYERLDKDGIKHIQIAPEYAGKHSQWGTLQEVMEIASENKRLRWCMDFGHAHACTNGGMKTKGAFDKLLEEIEKFDRKYLTDLHIQACGITYSEKGEKYHTPFESEESTLNWKGMLQSLKEFKVGGMFIAETPQQEHDALLCKKYYEGL